MLSRRVVSTTTRSIRPASLSQSHIQRAQFSSFRPLRALTETEDPEMNGGYINPPAVKRSRRDPYGDWTDKQERRNFGEPVHEDNDVLGVFSLEDYTHMSPRRGLILWTGFIGAVLGVVFTVKATYPDRPSAPKEYTNGLEKELGGAGALRAFQAGDELK